MEGSIKKIIEKIQNLFSFKFSIEVYALDENGESIQLFKGMCGQLEVADFCDLVRCPSCLYMFTIIGSCEDVNEDIGILRKEFCWLTDPLAPIMSEQHSTSIHVSWSPVRCCGVNCDIFSQSLLYSLFIAEGRCRSIGRFRNYINDSAIPEGDYQLICKGIHIYRADIADLKPNTVYHFRLHIEFLGNCHRSPVTAFPTLVGVPSTPSPPRVHVMKRVCSYDEHGKEPRVHVLWTAPYDSGAKITNYQVQVQEILLCPSEFSSHNHLENSASHVSITQPATDTMSVNTDSILQLQYDMMESLDDLNQPDGEDKELPNGIIASKWTVVFHNLLTEAIIAGPSKDCVKWVIRVRAQNSVGWSFPSPSVSLSYRTHPSLFPAAFELKKAFSPEKSSILRPFEQVAALAPVMKEMTESNHQQSTPPLSPPKMHATSSKETRKPLKVAPLPRIVGHYSTK